jgi:DNA-binding transcriptional MerR regulator
MDRCPVDLECTPAHTVEDVTTSVRIPVLPAQSPAEPPAARNSGSDQGSFSIAEVSARSGLSADTLRYYERIGLIDPPARNTAGRRTYVREDLDWLGFLIKMRSTGLPLRALREYAALRRARTEAGAGRRKQILLEYPRDIRSRIAALEVCLETLDCKIDNYEQIERKLAAVSGGEAAAS